MTSGFDPDRNRRRSIRLSRYDYRSVGAYFITVCTHERACLFGQVVDGEMRKSDLGEVADEEWWRTAAVRANVELRLHELVVMPNHIHGIVRIARHQGSLDGSSTARHVLPDSLGAIVRSYKAIVTRRINALRGTAGVPVWQRNDYEHVIRDEAGLDRIVAYIANNPGTWMQDTLFADWSEMPSQPTED